MAKIRVHEIAKEYDVTAKEVINFLHGHNIEVTNLSSLEDNAVSLIRGKYGKQDSTDDKKERPKKKASISAVYNPQNSKMGNRRPNNGNRNERNGDRPQRNNGDRPRNNNGDRPQRNNGDRPRYDGDRPQRNNGDRSRYDGDRPQRNNGDRSRYDGDRQQRIMATDRREDLATDRRDRKMVIEMAVMKEKTTIIKKVSRVIAAAVIVLEVIETIDRTVRIVQERREDA